MRQTPEKLARLFEAKADMGYQTPSTQILVVIIIPTVRILYIKHFPQTSAEG